MSECCKTVCHAQPPLPDLRYRKILWIALIINLGMFVVEIVSGFHANSGH